jgi:hypothetical protein
VSTETIPELLARLEREHPKRDSQLAKHPRFAYFCGKCLNDWPCDIARLVAHTRSLEAVAAKGRDLLACNHEERPLRNAMPICFACYDALTAAMVAIDTILAPLWTHESPDL